MRNVETDEVNEYFALVMACGSCGREALGHFTCLIADIRRIGNEIWSRIVRQS